jgi:predicted DNA-binding transcriptional regulator AlpA
MEIKYLKIEKILTEYLPISKSQFYNYINLDLIPKPLKIGRTSVWEHQSLMIALQELPNKLKK